MEKLTLTISGAMLLGIWFQTAFYPFPDTYLSGVTWQTTRFPRLTYTSFVQGEFAADLEAWLSERLGFRGLMIKTANQINYSVFRETKADRERAGTQVVMGRDGWLYEWAYIQSAISKKKDPAVDVSRFRQFSAWADENGIATVYLFTPSKAALYPEYLPRRYATRVNQDANRAYRLLIKELQRHGLKTVDGPAIPKREKREDQIVFYPGDTHWNEPGVLATIADLMESTPVLNDAAWPTLGVYRFEDCNDPDHRHRELDALLNTWWNNTAISPWVHARAEVVQNGRPPRVLIVGNSFNELFSTVLARLGFAEYVHLYYYNKSILTYPEVQRVEIAEDMRSPEYILKYYDVVILEANQSDPSSLGYDFLAGFFR